TRFLTETFPAFRALIRFLPSVSSFMLSYTGFLTEAFPAFRALIRSLPSVSSL
ncbi:hypothetical protein NDU88_008040, partial [Pleurodeles waltl]